MNAIYSSNLTDKPTSVIQKEIYDTHVKIANKEGVKLLFSLDGAFSYFLFDDGEMTLITHKNCAVFN